MPVLIFVRLWLYGVDVAKEIADELRNAAREERKSAGKGSSSSGKGGKLDKDSEEDSSGAEDGEEEDDGAVVAIEEPDQLALLYMNMARAKVKAPSRLSTAVAGQPGVLAGAAASSMSAAPVPVSLLSPDVKVERTGVCAGAYDEDGDVVTLLSAEEEAAWRSTQLSKSLSQPSGTQVSSSSSRGSGSQIIDLMEDYCLGEAAGQGEDAYSRDVGLERAQDDGDLSAALYLADEERGGGDALGDAEQDTCQFPDSTEEPPGGSTEEELRSRAVVSSNIVQDEGDFYSEQTHKGTLEALAQKAWSSAAPTQTPKNNKAGFKFAPSLKKSDRNDSTGSLGRLERTIEAVGIATTAAGAEGVNAARCAAETREDSLAVVNKDVVCEDKDAQCVEPGL